jgi:hypothetical protein
MSFLKRLFGVAKLNGEQMAQSSNREEYGPIDLLHSFVELRALHSVGEQQRWTRALPQPYNETLDLFRKQGWLAENGMGHWVVTDAAKPIIEIYGARLARERAEAMAKVRAALGVKDTGEALDLRRAYEARFPLGEAYWTGPEPQLSHSALTRRIFFLEHWLLDGLGDETVVWLKSYAAEQHLWGAFWQVDTAQIPAGVQTELAHPEMDISEAVYWRAYQLALFVDNQETWQRCKGGDHVRRLAIVGPDDEHTCDVCRDILGNEYLVSRVPELPVRACSSSRGCRCRYEPVLESYEDVDA